MEPYIGFIAAFGFNFAPRGWLICQGQIISIAQNTALFSLLGTTYGGNGQTTFALPDLQGRTAVGQGQGSSLTNRVMGQAAGTESITLSSNQIPMHLHSAQGLTNTSTSSQAGSAIAAAGDAITPLNNYLALSPKIGSGPNATQLKTYATAAAGSPVSLGGSAITTNTTTSGNTAVAGGSQPVSILQPYLTINYSIAIEGIFPSRN